SRAPPGRSLRYQKRVFLRNQWGVIRSLKTSPAPRPDWGPRRTCWGEYHGSPGGRANPSPSTATDGSASDPPGSSARPSAALVQRTRRSAGGASSMSHAIRAASLDLVIGGLPGIDRLRSSGRRSVVGRACFAAARRPSLIGDLDGRGDDERGGVVGALDQL